MPEDRKPACGESPCIATAMRKASRRLSQLYDDALAPSGLRTTQYAILSELERRSKRPPTMRELADAMVMDRSALGHNLRPLERDGLIALKRAKKIGAGAMWLKRHKGGPSTVRPNVIGRLPRAVSRKSTASISRQNRLNKRNS